MEQLLTSGQIAKRLGVTLQTVYKYIHEGKLEEVQRVGRIAYYREVDVDALEEQLREQREVKGLTSRDVAEYLGVSQATAIKYMREGAIPSYLRMYRGRETLFTTKEAVQRFETTGTVRGGTQIVRPEEPYALFQLFRHPSGEQARIIELGEPGKVLTSYEREISIYNMQAEGFQPVYEVKSGSYNNGKGTFILEFLLPSTIQGRGFRLIDAFYQQVGTANFRMLLRERTVRLESKPSIIDLTGIELEWIREHLISGRMREQDGKLRLDSNLEPVTAYMESELKEKVKKLAERAGMTMEELVVSILRKELSEEE